MEEEKKDRISSLLEIISRIKTEMRYAENERKLDTREGTRLPNLEICARGYYDDFACINKTLTQCPTNVNLKKIKLKNDYLRTSQVVCSLIRHAINRNVQEVDLSISPYDQEVFSYDDELFFNNSCFTCMNIAYCAFIPPNGAIRWDNLKYLCISHGKLVDDSIGKMLLGSPCLETLELRQSTLDDIEEELLSGLLSSLSHVNEIILGSSCSKVLSCLKAKGFQFSKDVSTSPGIRR